MFNLILPRVNVRRQSAWYKDGEQQDMSPSDAQARLANPGGFAWSAHAHVLPGGVYQGLRAGWCQIAISVVAQGPILSSD